MDEVIVVAAPVVAAVVVVGVTGHIKWCKQAGLAQVFPALRHVIAYFSTLKKDAEQGAGGVAIAYAYVIHPRAYIRCKLIRCTFGGLRGANSCWHAVAPRCRV